MRISAETTDINKVIALLGTAIKINCTGIDCEKGVALEVDVPILPNVKINLVPQVVSGSKIGVELNTDRIFSGLNAAGALFGNDIMSLIEKQSAGLLKRESKSYGIVDLEQCCQRFSLPAGIDVSSIDLEKDRVIIEFKMQL